MLIRPDWRLSATGPGDLLILTHFDERGGEGVFAPYSQLTTAPRILGVRGVVCRDGKFLWGLRSQSVSTYQGHWELAPSGALPKADYRAHLAEELLEETGLRATRITPMAILGEGRVLDLCCRVEAEGELHGSSEHTQLLWSRSPPGMPLLPHSTQFTRLHGG